MYSSTTSRIRRRGAVAESAHYEVIGPDVVRGPLACSAQVASSAFTEPSCRGCYAVAAPLALEPPQPLDPLAVHLHPSEQSSAQIRR